MLKLHIVRNLRKKAEKLRTITRYSDWGGRPPSQSSA